MKKVIPKIKKYDGGFFVDDAGNLNQQRLDAANQIAQLGAGAVNMLQPVNGDSNAGIGALSGGLSGAGTGAKIGGTFGPEGALVGGAIGLGVGAVSGLISGGKKHKAYIQQQQQNTKNAHFNTINNMTTTNIDPYGSQMMELGDTVPDGTQIPQKKVGGLFDSNKRAYVDSVLNANKKLDWVQRLRTPNSPSIQVNGEPYRSTHLMSDDGKGYVFPSIVRGKDGKLQYLGDRAEEYARQTNTGIQLPQEQGSWFAANGYKKGTGVLNSINNKGIPYANPNYADGDYVLDGGPGDKKKPINIETSQITFPKPGDPYWKTNPLITEHSDGTLRLWGEKPPILDIRNTKQKLNNNVLIENPSSTIPNTVVHGSGDGINPSLIMQPKTPSPATIHSTSGYYERGGMIGLSARAAGKFSFPNAGLKHYAPQLGRINKSNPYPTNVIKFEDGADTPVNTQQNMINIQKGELLINPEDGKILQEYSGINPLTGGKYENHSKGNKEESPNNFTMADPGLFVITKKTAKQYKDAVDNNDKISQKTVLMNIRNAKIAKQGGLQPKQFAYGDEIPNTPLDYYRNNNPQLPTLTLPNNPPSINGINLPNSNSLIKPTTLAGSNNTSYVAGVPNNSGISAGLDTLAKYGPSIFNIGQGLFGKINRQAYANPISNPYASQVIANMPKNVDMSQVRNDIYSNQELANKDLQNRTNSAGVYRANRQALNNNTNRALSTARMQAQELNNQAAGQRSYMYNALGYQDVQEKQQERQYNLGVDDINNRREAAKSNLLNAGLSQLQQTYQNDKTNAQRANMDKYTLDLLGQIFPNTKYYNQFQIDYVNKLRNQ